MLSACPPHLVVLFRNDVFERRPQHCATTGGNGSGCAGVGSWRSMRWKAKPERRRRHSGVEHEWIGFTEISNPFSNGRNRFLPCNAGHHHNQHPPMMCPGRGPQERVVMWVTHDALTALASPALTLVCGLGEDVPQGGAQSDGLCKLETEHRDDGSGTCACK